MRTSFKSPKLIVRARHAQSATMTRRRRRSRRRPPVGAVGGLGRSERASA